MLDNVDLVWQKVKGFPNLISILVCCLILYVCYELFGYFNLNIPISLFEFNFFSFLKIILFFVFVVLIINLINYTFKI